MGFSGKVELTKLTKDEISLLIMKMMMICQIVGVS